MEFNPRVIAFLCKWFSFPNSNLVGTEFNTGVLPPNLRPPITSDGLSPSDKTPVKFDYQKFIELSY